MKRVLVSEPCHDKSLAQGNPGPLSDLGADVTVVTFTGGNADTGYARLEWKDRWRDAPGGGTGDRCRLGIHRRIFLATPGCA